MHPIRHWLNLLEAVSRPRDLPDLNDQERHHWLEFIWSWLTGHHMKNQGPDALTNWRQITKWFPPKVPAQVNLFRVVTIPISLAQQQSFTFRPARWPVSSWSAKLTGSDAVAGVALDFDETKDTARVAIEATLPGKLILATTPTICKAFMTLSFDYFDRYPEQVNRKVIDGQTYVSYSYPGYPGNADSPFTMDEIDFLRDVLKRKGGSNRQYECVVETPDDVNAKIVQVYRVGEDTVRIGNDDPHAGRAPKVSQLTPEQIARLLHR